MVMRFSDTLLSELNFFSYCYEELSCSYVKKNKNKQTKQTTPNQNAKEALLDMASTLAKF